MMLLTSCGKPVHKKVGRRHFLSIFIGGGIFGNLGIWLYYLMKRRSFLQAVLPHFDSNIIVDKLNSAISCRGASAGVNAILSFGACCSVERVAKRLRACHARGENLELDIPFILDAFNIVFTIRVFSTDVAAMIMSVLEVGFFDELKTTGKEVAYGLQYAWPGHLGGMVFGIIYYYFMYIR